MDKGLYVSMTGAQALLRAQATVANNLANKDTTGFKAGEVSTDDFRVPGSGFASRVDAITRDGGFDASAGPVMVTGNDTDIALAGDTWLAVQAADGSEAYTRGGELRISANGLLQTKGGRTVLGDGGPIAVPPHAKLAIAGDGTIAVVPLGSGAESTATVGRLRLVTMDRADPFTRGEDGLMRARNAPARATGDVVTAGAIEGSNVDVAGSLVQMIDVQRQFELQVKLMRNGEDMARASATMLRLGG